MDISWIFVYRGYYIHFNRILELFGISIKFRRNLDKIVSDFEQKIAVRLFQNYWKFRQKYEAGVCQREETVEEAKRRELITRFSLYLENSKYFLWSIAYKRAGPAWPRLSRREKKKSASLERDYNETRARACAKARLFNIS